MSRRGGGGGGPGATQQQRMNFNQGGVQTYYHQQQPGMRPPQQQPAAQSFYIRQPIRMPHQMGPHVPQQRGGQGQQPMQFQQPPPGAPGQQQPQPPQGQPPSSQQALAQGQYNVTPSMFIMYSQPTPRMFYQPHGAINQAYVPPTYSTAQPMGFSQPPPPMPNQVAQQRPQTPPNPAALPGMTGAPMIHGNPYHMNPAAAAATAAAAVVSQSHHMQPGVATTLATPPGPPPHAGPSSGQPAPGAGAPPYQPPQASANKPYEKRKRLNAIKIINPETQEEINLDQANPEKQASESSSTAQTASSSEVSNETKDDTTSKDDNETKTEARPQTQTATNDSKAEETASSDVIPSATSSSLNEDLDNGKSKQKSTSKKDEENSNQVVTAIEVTEEPVAKNEDTETTEATVVETSEETDGSCISKAVEEAPVNDEQVENNHEANAATVASTPDQENHQQASSEADEALENGTNSSATSSTPASKSSSLIKLKYEYPAEQWSPINTAGKKQYGREFLVKLSNDPLSKVKPSNLPNMDIIKDKLNPDKTKFSIPANLNKDWTPGFVKPTTSKTGLNTKGGSRDSKAANKRAGPPTVINLTLNTNIELNKAENAWKPDALRKEPNTNEDPQLELERNIRSILNKLTPQKFDKLVKKFNELNIDSEDKLKAAIELIFEKAVDEPEFSVAYARMCEVLREKKVKTTEGPLDFRKLLIGRCQKEFERDYMEGFDRAKFEVELKAAETEEKRKELQHEFEEKERRARRRSLGNIRFIGELYNLKMLTDRIMHEIINKLIKQIDEESLECLCWLLNTIGKVLDQATQAKLSAPQSDESKAVQLKPFEYYFNEMETIIKTKPLPSRVRFMLQDVIDLRRNNWKPRREKAGPKTIDQIHIEAEREKTQAKLMEMQPVTGGGGGGGGNRGGDRGKRSQRGDRRDFQGQGNDDEWNTVAYRGSNKNANFNEKIDAQKVITLAASSRKDADSMTFGPGNRMGWGKGSGQKTPSQQSSNRFAAMQNSDSFGSDAGSRRNYSASMGNFARGGTDRGNHPGSDERQNAIDSVRKFSAMSSATNGPGKQAVNTTPSSAAAGSAVGGPSMSVDFGHASGTRPAPTTVSEAQMAIGQTDMLKGSADLSLEVVERKSKTVIEEYLHSSNAESALQDVCADFHPSHMRDVATAMLMKVLEGNSKDMMKTGELLDYLVDKHALLPSQLQNAFFNEVFDPSSDLEIDIPKLWENVAMILGPILASEKSLQPKFLLDSMAHLKSNQVPVFLKHVLNSIANIKGRDKAGEMLRRHNVSLSQFMPSDKVPEFITSTGIDYVPASNDNLRSDLARLLAENPKSNDAIFSWIEKNVPVEDRTEQPKEFLRTLARVVAESSLKIDPQRNDHQYLEETFILRCPLLKKFVDQDVNRETQVLYSLQHLMHDMEHPNKMLTNFFFALYNNDVISDEGFEAWIQCTDPSEELGKGVAHKSTTQFFTWLRENDGDEDLEDEIQQQNTF